VTEGSAKTISAQIGRPLRASSEVVASCHLGLPVVVAVPPLLDDGTPFPTRYWLTCPLAVRRVSRLESAGEIKRLERRRLEDSDFEAALSGAHARYELERDRLLPLDAQRRPRGGVGGSASGVKCLHAHYADAVAGNDNPVGRIVASDVEPLNCVVPCVLEGERNPEWREPKPSP
jgi:hypothetical protein